jgi:hypothetical protein
MSVLFCYRSNGLKLLSHRFKKILQLVTSTEPSISAEMIGIFLDSKVHYVKIIYTLLSLPSSMLTASKKAQLNWAF